MNFLMDTHTLIWVMEGSNELSDKVVEVVEDFSNMVFVSTVNLWEISLKVSLGKLSIKGIQIEELPKSIAKMDLGILELNANDSSTFHKLDADYHKDPFDRILIWQAIQNDFVLLTRDSIIAKYQSVGLKTFW